MDEVHLDFCLLHPYLKSPLHHSRDMFGLWRPLLRLVVLEMGGKITHPENGQRGHPRDPRYRIKLDNPSFFFRGLILGILQYNNWSGALLTINYFEKWTAVSIHLPSHRILLRMLHISPLNKLKQDFNSLNLHGLMGEISISMVLL